MEINSDQLIIKSIQEGIKDSISKRFSSGYNNPLDKVIEQSIKESDGQLKKLINDSLSECLTDENFQVKIKSAVRQSLAKTLVQRFGGELEKQVNALKSNPATRARITLAIEEILKTA